MYQNTETIETTQMNFFRAVFVQLLHENVEGSYTAIISGV
jgi:hypothetical protein